MRAQGSERATKSSPKHSFLYITNLNSINSKSRDGSTPTNRRSSIPLTKQPPEHPSIPSFQNSAAPPPRRSDHRSSQACSIPSQKGARGTSPCSSRSQPPSPLPPRLPVTKNYIYDLRRGKILSYFFCTETSVHDAPAATAAVPSLNYAQTRTPNSLGSIRAVARVLPRGYAEFLT
jgi:hypothetical protein